MKKIIFIFVAIMIISYIFKEKQPAKLKEEISIINDAGVSDTIIWYSDNITGKKVDLSLDKFYEPGIKNIKKGWQYYLTLPKFLGYMLFNLFFCYIFAGGMTQRLFSKIYYPLGLFIPIWIFDFIIKVSIMLTNLWIDNENKADE